jgi:hypothetical protein
LSFKLIELHGSGRFTGTDVKHGEAELQDLPAGVDTYVCKYISVALGLDFHTFEEVFITRLGQKPPDEEGLIWDCSTASRFSRPSERARRGTG